MNDDYWSWILSAIGVCGLMIAANAPKAGWCLSLGNQVLWAWYAIQTRQYGFLVSCFAYGTAHVRLLRREFGR